MTYLQLFLRTACLGALLSFTVPQAAALTSVAFFDDFDGNITFGDGVGGFTAGVRTVSGQGLVGRGNAGNEFAGNITRNALRDTVTITLTNLPDHDRISLGFLFAALDTWDGTDVLPGAQSPDFFNVTVDGVSIFSESFRNLPRSGDSLCGTNEICQSYVAPLGGQIATGGNGGFGNIGFGGGSDGAYDMYLDSTFQYIAHTSDSVVISFFGSGGGNQGLADESFGLDNITVSVTNVPVPPALILFGSALGLLLRRRRP